MITCLVSFYHWYALMCYCILFWMRKSQVPALFPNDLIIFFSDLFKLFGKTYFLLLYSPEIHSYFFIRSMFCLTWYGDLKRNTKYPFWNSSVTIPSDISRRNLGIVVLEKQASIWGRGGCCTGGGQGSSTVFRIQSTFFILNLIISMIIHNSIIMN